MYQLTNDDLTVSVLDPETDVARLGSRYCTGGSVWQVTDRQRGALLVGPEWPNPTPVPFNGQGMPDAFEQVLGADAPVGGEVLVLGVGTVRRDTAEPFHPRSSPHVTQFCRWEVEAMPQRVVMRTEQRYQRWALTLTRTVTLTGRTVEVGAHLTNTGEEPIPLRWFAHPFFPKMPDGEYCRFNLPVAVVQNPAFTVSARGFIKERPEFDWERGYFQRLALPWGQPLEVEERHPTVGAVHVSVDFPVASLPIWANAHTFSFEPYLDRIVPVGDEAAWGMRYRF